eukprot:TRINITY_DN2577_c0_g2_i1.p1 TRINITY_DN2577_c0_g2~~TRINITY_DN2577_c0_g2_i1.p1  ORF type:complete len:104 (+),score=35.42 TRINITY_DN2577_c0_g2_i1:147-458(+)
MNKGNQQNDQSSRRGDVDSGISKEGKKGDVSSKATMNERGLNTGTDMPLGEGLPGSRQQQGVVGSQQESLGQDRLGKQSGLGQQEKLGKQSGLGQQEQKRTDI